MPATPRDISLHRLTGDQVKVITALVGGATHEAAAQAGGVHRVTVTRWANHHPAFIAEMNRIFSEMMTESQIVAMQTTRAALKAAHQAVASGDVEAAFRWLRMAPSFGREDHGPTESAALVERFRKGMPTSLDTLLKADEATEAAAETEILRRLESHQDD